MSTQIISVRRVTFDHQRYTHSVQMVIGDFGLRTAFLKLQPIRTKIFSLLKNSAEFLSAFTSRSSAQHQKAPDLPYSARRKEREIPHPLVVGREYHFSKEGHRIYQIDVPMDLRTNDWKFLGRIIITEFIVGKNRTEGTFILVKEFSDQERETITKTYVSDEEVNKILKEIK